MWITLQVVPEFIVDLRKLDIRHDGPLLDQDVLVVVVLRDLISKGVVPKHFLVPV